MSKDIFKLYSFYYSSASWRVRIALNLKNLKYEYIPINLTEGEQLLKSYEKINPSLVKIFLFIKSVPTLVHNNNFLYESTAIIEYLDKIYPDINPLLPEDPV